jgi:ribosomal protein S18 acetylase RimI-like enzyme
MTPGVSPTFKPAALTDLNLLLSLMQEYYAHDQLALDEVAARLALTGLIKNESFGRVWIIWAGAEVAGYVVLTLGFSLPLGGPNAYVDEIYLRPDFRRQGLGRRALLWLEETARQWGIKALHLEVERENIPAQALYRQMGFKDEPCYLMTCWLNPIVAIEPVNPGQITVTPASPADIESFVTVMQEQNEPFNESSYRTGLTQLLSNDSLGGVWLIQAGPDRVGYVALTYGYSLEYHGRDAMLDQLYLHPAYRGQNLDTWPIECAVKVCQSQGITALHLEVERSDVESQKFYRRIGFEDHHRFLLTKRLAPMN